jgi:hypothetical protein
MIKDGLAFDFTAVPDDLVDKSWIPSYCKA